MKKKRYGEGVKRFSIADYLYWCADMYRQFQHDLYRMRLETARNYVGVLQKSLTPISVSQTDPVKLHVEVMANVNCFQFELFILKLQLILSSKYDLHNDHQYGNETRFFKRIFAFRSGTFQTGT